MAGRRRDTARSPTGDDRLRMPRTPRPALELRAALRSCGGVLVALALITATLNVLYLTSSFFMLEVYDRVVPSRSVPTLVALALLAVALFGFHGFLDIIRTRVMIRVGSWADRALSGRVYDMIARLPLKSRTGGDGMQPLRDLDQLRSFLSGLGPTALFDLPWIPFYLALCFLFHPLIGLTALVGSIVLVSLTVLTDILTRAPIRRATGESASRNALAEASRRNADVLQAMGMRSRIAVLWAEANEKYLESQQAAVETTGTLGALSRILRIVLQSAVLGVGGYLVIQQEASSGIIIAGTILTARALAPVELAIAHWRGLVTARQGWQRLQQLSRHLPEERLPTPLPAPRKSLAVEAISVAPPGQQRLVVQDVSLALKAGDGLGIIGVSASGKSSLVRALVGAWTTARGKVRLDGAALDQWATDALGRHIGYLPQDVELLAGTVAQNISRFEANPGAAAIVEAAEAAGVHELALRLPQGYDTPVGEGGASLSAGQRQRIALARALYGNPFLVVLDEPNSNLDAAGDHALTQAILSVRARGGIAIVVAHRTVALTGIDQLLYMVDGRALAFGPKDLILSEIRQQRQPDAAPGRRLPGAKASRGLL
jgi:ATP-binding cassette, subfamily C, type I secretion system permease/ATPase